MNFYQEGFEHYHIASKQEAEKRLVDTKIFLSKVYEYLRKAYEYE